jgi:endonuclease YncB( thermonuclease family)
VGQNIRFRRRKWTRSRDYGAAETKRPIWPDKDRVTVRGVVRETMHWLVVFRPFILLAILISIFLSPLADPAMVEPPDWLAMQPEPVAEEFSRCGPGRGHGCVIDGDTFKLGERSVRIIGIDTPETHPARCAKEADLGEAATAKLQDLLNQGPFEMVAPVYGTTDRYGRDLRVVRRKLPDGGTQSIAAEMRESGLARRYLGGLRAGCC